MLTVLSQPAGQVQTEDLFCISQIPMWWHESCPSLYFYLKYISQIDSGQHRVFCIPGAIWRCLKLIEEIPGILLFDCLKPNNPNSNEVWMLTRTKAEEWQTASPRFRNWFSSGFGRNPKSCSDSRILLKQMFDQILVGGERNDKWTRLPHFKIGFGGDSTAGLEACVDFGIVSPSSHHTTFIGHEIFVRMFFFAKILK